MHQSKRYVWLFAYTFDLQNIAEELIGAKDRGVDALVVLDKRTSMSSRPRDQHQLAQRLHANGVRVVLMNGGS